MKNTKYFLTFFTLFIILGVGIILFFLFKNQTKSGIEEKLEFPDPTYAPSQQNELTIQEDWKEFKYKNLSLNHPQEWKSDVVEVSSGDGFSEADINLSNGAYIITILYTENQQIPVYCAYDQTELNNFRQLGFEYTDLIGTSFSELSTGSNLYRINEAYSFQPTTKSFMLCQKEESTNNFFESHITYRIPINADTAEVEAIGRIIQTIKL